MCDIACLLVLAFRFDCSVLGVQLYCELGVAEAPEEALLQEARPGERAQQSIHRLVFIASCHGSKLPRHTAPLIGWQQPNRDCGSLPPYTCIEGVPRMLAHPHAPPCPCTSFARAATSVCCLARVHACLNKGLIHTERTTSNQVCLPCTPNQCYPCGQHKTHNKTHAHTVFMAGRLTPPCLLRLLRSGSRAPTGTPTVRQAPAPSPPASPSKGHQAVKM